MKHNIFHWQNGLGDYFDIDGDIVNDTSLHNGRQTFENIVITMNEVKYIIKGCGQCHELFIAENTTIELMEDDDET